MVPWGRDPHPVTAAAAEDFSVFDETDHQQKGHPEPAEDPRAADQALVPDTGHLRNRHSGRHAVDLENCHCVDLENFHWAAGHRGIYHLDDLCSHHHYSLCTCNIYKPHWGLIIERRFISPFPHMLYLEHCIIVYK